MATTSASVEPRVKWVRENLLKNRGGESGFPAGGDDAGEGACPWLPDEDVSLGSQFLAAADTRLAGGLGSGGGAVVST
jgi:hypothetical protein